MPPISQRPASAKARLARALGHFSGLRGHNRLVEALLPMDPGQAFVVKGVFGWFGGHLGSFVDRQVYLHGGYEKDQIRLFLEATAGSPRRLVLDVGANVGNHSLAFRQAFEQVHAFEPNPAIWSAFERNMALNETKNVELHKVALSREDGAATLFSPDGGNLGMGTLSEVDQYDDPLRPVAKVTVVRGDTFLADRAIGPVDAVKIDVQGFEREVIEGLRETLRRDRPAVWVEIGAGSSEPFHSVGDFLAIFPWPARLDAYRLRRRGPFVGWTLAPVEDRAAPLLHTDYIVRPAD